MHTLIYILGWIYLSGIMATFLYWFLEFLRGLFRGIIDWEAASYILRIMVMVVPASWYGLHTSIKSHRRIKKQKAELRSTFGINNQLNNQIRKK